MDSLFAKVAGVAGMTALVTAAGVGFGAGTAVAKPKPVVPVPGPSHTTMTVMSPGVSGQFQTRIDNFIDSFYPRGEQSPLDRFSDVFTPLAK